MTFTRSAKSCLIALALCVGLQGCPSGGGGGGGDGGVVGGESLTVSDVEQVLAQAIAEGLARGVTGTIAVADRVGNVLAVFRMTGAATLVTVTSGRGVVGGA